MRIRDKVVARGAMLMPVALMLAFCLPVAPARAYVYCSWGVSSVQNTINAPTGGGETTDPTSCSTAAPTPTFPGTSYQTVLINNQPTDFPFSLTGDITGQASATDGTLHAESVSIVHDTPESVFYTDPNNNTIAVNNPFAPGQLSTRMGSTFDDTLTVHNPTGGAVLMTFSIDLSATVNTSACVNGYQSNGVGYTVLQPLIDSNADASFVIDSQSLPNGGTLLDSRKDTCFPLADVSNLKVQLSFNDGAVIGIAGRLDVESDVSWGFQPDANYNPVFLQDPTAVADASNTSHYYVDVNTPGANYTDGEGNTNAYATPAATPVPEPGGATLLVVGLLGIGAMRRGRKRAA